MEKRNESGLGKIVGFVADSVGTGVVALTSAGIPYDVSTNDVSVYEAATDPLNIAIALGFGAAVTVVRKMKRNYEDFSN
jgi:hypothetical protein|tara:strand:+ start:989 stop:1225 length:237 start_codon:yes stop_codon:yes gene_type:complete